VVLLYNVKVICVSQYIIGGIHVCRVWGYASVWDHLLDIQAMAKKAQPAVVPAWFKPMLRQQQTMMAQQMDFNQSLSESVKRLQKQPAAALGDANQPELRAFATAAAKAVTESLSEGVKRVYIEDNEDDWEANIPPSC
jgi:hypothetical protein